MKNYEEAIAYLSAIVIKQPYAGTAESIEVIFPELKALSWVYGVSFSEMYTEIYSYVQKQLKKYSQLWSYTNMWNIDEIEGQLYELLSRISFMATEARKANKPVDVSCLKLNKYELEAFHNLSETCNDFLKEYKYLTEGF